MAHEWPKNPKVIGTKVKRLDGPVKATGRAKYSLDIHRPGMLFAVFVSSPHAHAIIESIDTAGAEKTAGFEGLHIIKDKGAEVVHVGEPILAIAAKTEVQAYDAARAIKIAYQVLPHAVKEEVSSAADGPKVTNKDDNVRKGRGANKGDIEKGLKESAVTIERTYGLASISHCCLEPHGLVVEWKDNTVTCWCSTQATQNVAQDLAKEFKIPVTDAKCITHMMGGGFGSKFNAGVEGFACAHLAKKTGKPVKLFLNRSEEHSAGVRPSAAAKIRAGASKDGLLVAFEAEAQGSPGIGTSANFPLPYVYEEIPNQSTSMASVRLNHHMTRAYRAPGHPQGCFIMEAVMDDLAAKLNLDPLEMRIRNIKALPDAVEPVRSLYLKELALGADLFKWKQKWRPPGSDKGIVRRGVGLGCHKWAGRGRPKEQMLCEIHPDGTILVRSSTQDLGTGNRTVLAIVAAEVFGLKPTDITVKIGESDWEASHGSGGSTTCPSTAPATLIAAQDARDKLFEKLAKHFDAEPKDLACANGAITAKGKSMPWKDAVRKLGMDKISIVGQYDEMTLSSQNVGGCQFAEVEVDTETGQVRCIEVVAVQDTGLIINKLACEAQVAGAVVMSVNAALYEERVYDQPSGRHLNGDMEFYKLGMIGDMPRIKVHMFDESMSLERGVIGIGEPPTISTAAAIGNAVFNALGVRVPFAPITPRRVLEALAKGTLA